MSSSHDNEDLIDYEDEHDVVPNGATHVAAGGLNRAAVDGEEGAARNFSGIHSTGFRCGTLLSPYFPLIPNSPAFLFQRLLTETRTLTRHQRFGF